jgi:large subunit ribosomal protein L9
VEIILLSDQRHLGKRGQLVDVKPGYARNFLLPQGLALPATKSNVKLFEQQRSKIDARHAQEKAEAETFAARLQGLSLRIAKRVGETGTLYGSVSAGDVAEALAGQGVTIDRRKIEIEGDVKTLGDHTVRIELHSEVVAELTVSVVAEE